MFKLLRVTGDSLKPRIKEGDFVLVSKIPFLLNSLKSGDIIVFKDPEYGLLIKLIAGMEDNQQRFSVKGIHNYSLNSYQLGLVDKDAIIGKVLFHFARNRPSIILTIPEGGNSKSNNSE